MSFQTQSVICGAMLRLGGFSDAMRHLDGFSQLAVGVSCLFRMIVESLSHVP